jgi:tRNA(Arg) A34 adenosine deaminase TadA
MRSERPPTAVVLELPGWLVHQATDVDLLPDLDDRMAFVVELARGNVAHALGGPFAAAVFKIPSGELLAAGVNLVVPSRASIAHAEIIALALAGQRLDHHHLRSDGPTELVTSCEPCAMCLGALAWSGVASVVTGARDEDARAVGFDEGDKPGDWQSSLRARGIDVTTDVRREDAAAVLQDYVRRGGPIYNGITS